VTALSLQFELTFESTANFDSPQQHQQNFSRPSLYLPLPKQWNLQQPPRLLRYPSRSSIDRIRMKTTTFLTFNDSSNLSSRSLIRLVELLLWISTSIEDRSDPFLVFRYIPTGEFRRPRALEREQADTSPFFPPSFLPSSKILSPSMVRSHLPPSYLISLR